MIDIVLSIILLIERGAHQLRWAASRRLGDRRMLVKRPCSEARFAPGHKAANEVSAAGPLSFHPLIFEKSLMKIIISVK
jgi:hypothetical protein